MNNFDFIQISINAQIALGIAIIAFILTFFVFGKLKKDNKKR